MKIKIKKIITIIITIFIGICVIIFSFRSYFMLSVNDYYNNSLKAFKIPGINDNFVGQGLDYDPISENFFVSGYQTNNNALLYLVNSHYKITKQIKLYENDIPLKIHSGGITIYKDYVYIAGGNTANLYIFSYQEIIEAKHKAKINALKSFSLKYSNDDYLNPAFVFINEKNLIVGEFFKEKEYPTLKSHKFVTLDDSYNQALALSFPLKEDASFYLDEPDCAYSIPDLVQGMAYDKGIFYLSTSYGLNFSYISSYSKANLIKINYVVALNKKLPLYAFDSLSLIKKRKIPPMSEEIIILDDYLYTMNESASNRYIFGKFLSASYCYKTKITFFS